MSRRILPILTILLAFLYVASGCQSSPKPQSTDPALQAQAEQWLATLEYPDDDRDPQRRWAALELGRQKYAPAVDALARHLAGDIDPQTRTVCARALGMIGGDAATQALVAALSDFSEDVRTAAIEALAGTTDNQAIAAMEERVRFDNANIALAAAQSLMKCGQTREAVEKLLDERNKQVAEPAARARIVYVDAKNGSDDNKGEETRPVKTIARGLDLLERFGTLMIAGTGNGPIREAVAIPARLSGEPGQPTRIMAWPNKPRPLLQPTTYYPAERFKQNAQGRWTLSTEQPVFGAFVADGDNISIFPLVEKAEDLNPGFCRYDAEAREFVIDNGGAALGPIVEVAFSDDALRIDRAAFVEVTGLEVRYAPDSGLDANGAWGAAFIDCASSYCDRHGIFIYYSPDALVRDSRVQGCTYQGISVRSSPRTLVNRCRSTDNGVDGVLFLYDSDYCVAADNVIMRNRRAISFIEGSDFGRAIGNVMRENRIDRVQSETGSAGTFATEAH